MSYPYGPGPAAAEARTRAIREAERHDYASMTDKLWADAWGPAHPDGRGPVAYAFDITDNYAAGRTI